MRKISNTPEAIAKANYWAKPTCKNGHPRIVENVKYTKLGVKYCLLCSREEARKQSERESKEDTRVRYLRKAYKLTLEDFNNMLLAQNGKCKICGRDQVEFEKNLYVDHCHETLKIRGLLCHNCNLMLGYSNDNIEILEKAITYLKGYK